MYLVSREIPLKNGKRAVLCLTKQKTELKETKLEKKLKRNLNRKILSVVKGKSHPPHIIRVKYRDYLFSIVFLQ